MSMDYHVTTLERAFQMARSGQFASVADIKKQLKAEGFSLAQITGPTLGKQLKELIRAAQSEAEPQGGAPNAETGASPEG